MDLDLTFVEIKKCGSFVCGVHWEWS